MVSVWSPAVLLYDGECGFCAGSVQFVLRREQATVRDALHFAPLQGTFGTALRARFPELDGIDSVLWYDPVADRVLGRADAPVTVIEYASFSCHLCADWHQFVFPVFKQRLIDTGQVRFVFRNLPTAPEQMSLPAAALARCAAPEPPSSSPCTVTAPGWRLQSAFVVIPSTGSSAALSPVPTALSRALVGPTGGVPSKLLH